MVDESAQYTAHDLIFIVRITIKMQHGSCAIISKMIEIIG
jgi:hypothetical protein